MKTLLVLVLAGWLLMTPKGPVDLSPGVPVVFATKIECAEVVVVLHRQLRSQGWKGFRWYWCEPTVP